MTGEQKKWLEDHRHEGYRIFGGGGAPGGFQWNDRGYLHPDGTFELTYGRGRPSRIAVGSFEVGKLVEK